MTSVYPPPPSLLDRVREICPAYLSSALLPDGTTEIPDGAITVVPTQVHQVQELIHLATHADASIVPRGMGSSRSGGSLAILDRNRTPIVIDTTAHTEIEVDAIGRTIWAGAGASNQSIRVAAKSQDLCYPVDVVAGFSTIGGNVATDAVGVSGLRFGSTRDYVQDLHVVLANGSRVLTGSRQLHSFGTGFNFNHLFSGSEGTIGVIWDVRLRLMNRQNPPKTYMASFPTSAAAILAGQRTLRQDGTLWSLDYLDSTTTEGLQGNEFIAEHAGRHLLIVRTDNGPPEIDNVVFLTTREAELLQIAYSKKQYVTGPVCLVGCNSSDAEQLVYKAHEIGKTHSCDVGVHGSLGLGRFVVRFTGADIDTCSNFLYDHVVNLLDGSFTLEGIGFYHSQRFIRAKADLARATLAIKSALDPQQLLNPLKIL